LNILNIFGKGKTDTLTADRLRKLQTANEFVNVKDVCGPVLHTKDDLLFAYLRIQPFSLDLLSQREFERKIRAFVAEFSAEKKGFKLFSITRPVDISGPLARITALLAEATDPVRKDLLNKENRELSAFALIGNVIERQFHLIIWEPCLNDGERELLRRAHELENRFAGCEIVTDLCGQGMVVRLLNLFANPNYAHLEDDDVTPAIPFITEKGGRKRHESA